MLLLGASHIGVQTLLGVGDHVSKAWLEAFIDTAGLPLLPRMPPDALASLAAALPGLSSSLPRREKVLAALEEAVERGLARGNFPAAALEQVSGYLTETKLTWTLLVVVA
jgi:hypothetical protein